MFNPSNLYAEKVFAEHPLEMWSLDEKSDYISLIPESFRVLEDWSVTAVPTSGGVPTVTVDTVTDFSETTPPIDDTNISIFSVTPEAGFDSLDITFTSASTFTVTEEFALGFLIYANPYVSSVKIGYQVGSETPEMSDPILIHELEWKAISNTFSTLPSGAAKIIITVTISEASTAGLQYDSFITGISAGILAQEFSGSSIGTSITSPRPTIPGVATTDFLEAKSYSLSDNSGYYIVDGKTLRARSSAVPMVYGASSSTILSVADNNNPSLVVPGIQFLNSSGKLFDRTFECWLKVNSFSTAPRRIIGPTTSTDGLYAHGPMLTLKVGSDYRSHYVGEWSRPMLVDILIAPTKASLMINAEVVLSFDIDLKSESLPDSEDDWIGFYCYDDVPSVEIDCVAVYSYLVSETLAKKRYVYGQGVVLPESTNTSYGGSSMVIDYSFANYDKNYSFPKNSKWEYGISDNLKSDNFRISLPDYSLPTIFLGGKSESLWLDKLADANGQTQELNDMSAIHRSIIRMRPSTLSDGSSGWLDDEFSNVYPYILFDKFNLLSGSKTAGFYGVFAVEAANDKDQTLFFIKSTTSSYYFRVYANGSTINYSLNGTVLDSFTISGQTSSEFKKVAVGIDIEKIKNSSVEGFNMFSDTSNLYVYVAGEDSSNADTDRTMSGNIYGFGFMSASNLSEMSTVFNTDGLITADIANFNALKEYAPAYCLIATNIIDIVKIDILSSGKWEDNLPLSLFKKTINDNDYLSFMQVNVDYPEMTIYDLSSNYDTSDALVKFFVSFQKVFDGAVLSSGRTIVPMDSNGVVQPTTSWESETYEIIDGAIVYPPDLEADSLLIDDVNMILSMYFEIDGVLLNPVKVRSVDISSISFDEEDLREVGTKYGSNIYPFSENAEDLYVSSKDNPFKIYKSSSPHLYLTSKTGVSISGDMLGVTDEGYVHRGILLKINENLADPYSVSAAVISLRNNGLTFPETKKPLFELEGSMISGSEKKDAYLRFFIQRANTSGTRGVITCQLRLGGPSNSFVDYNGIDYYWNGDLVYQPEMSVNEWGILALSFHDFINLDGKEGRFEFHGNQTVNNVSIYSASQSSLQSSAITNTWNSARYDLGTWEKVLDASGFETPTNDPEDDSNWFQINVTLKNSVKPADPTDIYRAYLGINKIIVDTYDESVPQSLNVQKCEYIVYNTAGWHKNIIKPV
jgi:hypothetical protein